MFTPWRSLGLQVKLVDLSGYYARCDALVLASDLSWRPAADGAALARQGAKLNGEPAEIAEGGTYDVAVVGGGAAGVFEIRCYG